MEREPMASEMYSELKRRFVRRGRIIGLLLIVVILLVASRFI